MERKQHQEQPQGNGGAFGVWFPGGGFSGRGWIGVIALLVAASIGAFAALVYVNHLGFIRLANAQVIEGKRLDALHEIISQDHAARTTEHQRIVDGVSAIVYVLLLPEKEQERLLKSMEVPTLIREMERRR